MLMIIFAQISGGIFGACIAELGSGFGGDDFYDQKLYIARLCPPKDSKLDLKEILCAPKLSS